MAKIATVAAKSTTKKTTTTSGANESAQDQIAKLAYQFYVERGCLHGYDRQDWLRAEAIVKNKK